MTRPRRCFITGVAFSPLSTSAERREELKALMNTVTNTAAWQEQLAAMDGSQCSHPGILRPISLSRKSLLLVMTV